MPSRQDADTARMARVQRLAPRLAWTAPPGGATAAYNQEFEARMAAPTRLSRWLGELRRRRVVRVAIAYLIGAWVLIQVAAETFEPLGLPAWALKLVIVVAVLGFPAALILAWAFDVTPRGIERTAPADPSQPAAAGDATPPAQASAVPTGPSAVPVRPTAQPNAPAPSSTASRARPHRSVAVLPFVDMSAERDQDFFCDGVAEEIGNALCYVQELKIAARTSAFQFKGRAADVREIGHALGVDTVLEGSVRKAGDRIRVTAQLVGASDGYHLWSKTFDRKLEDVFAIQDEIAQQVTRALRTSLVGGETVQVDRGGTSNSDAYEYYLRGRALLRQHGAPRLSAKQMFLRSVSIDPKFALAHAGVAAAIADDLFWRQAKDPGEIAEALAAVRRAEELQPGLVEVMVARGSLLSAKGRNAEASAAFDAAIQRAPSYPDAYYWYARHAFAAGEHAKAAGLFERTIELEPTNYTAWGLRGSCLNAMGEIERGRAAHVRSLELIDRQLEMYPDDIRAIHFGASANAVIGRRERAFELIQRAMTLQPDSPPTLYNVACAYARLGDTDKALDLLERWRDTGAGGSWIVKDPDFDGLRDEPRFRAVLEHLQRHGA
jgi:adenylate cyclase